MQRTHTCAFLEPLRVPARAARTYPRRVLPKEILEHDDRLTRNVLDMQIQKGQEVLDALLGGLRDADADATDGAHGEARDVRIDVRDILAQLEQDVDHVSTGG